MVTTFNDALDVREAGCADAAEAWILASWHASLASAQLVYQLRLDAVVAARDICKRATWYTQSCASIVSLCPLVGDAGTFICIRTSVGFAKRYGCLADATS